MRKGVLMQSKKRGVVLRIPHCTKLASGCPKLKLGDKLWKTNNTILLIVIISFPNHKMRPRYDNLFMRKCKYHNHDELEVAQDTQSKGVSSDVGFRP